MKEMKEMIQRLEKKVEQQEKRIEKLYTENRVADAKHESMQKTLVSIEEKLDDLQYTPKELLMISIKILGGVIAVATLGVTILSWLTGKIW